MKTKIGWKIRNIRLDKGWTQRELAQKIDVPQAHISRWENDDMFPRPANVAKIAELIGQTPLEFMGQSEIPVSSLPGRAIEVITSVAAGDWAPSLEWDKEDRYLAPAMLPARWDNTQIYGAEVHGESMNRYYPDRSIVFFAPLKSIPGGLKPGMHVIVVRSDHGEYETTIKEYVVDESKQAWLWPRSSAPEHQTPLAYGNRRGSEVVITGVVIGATVLAPGMRYLG